MFDSTYFKRVNLVDNQRGTSKNHICTKSYSFKGASSIYIIQIEYYDYDVYILKFYLKNHRDSKNKFNLLSEDHDAQAVIRTVLDVAIDILENENKDASFGFMGAHKIKNTFEEGKTNTQRFRISIRLPILHSTPTNAALFLPAQPQVLVASHLSLVAYHRLILHSWLPGALLFVFLT